MSIPAYNPKELHFLFPQYCPCPSCDYYEDPDNYITKDGTYRVQSESKKRQRLKCNLGGHRFSETRYSALFGNHGSFQEYEQTAKMMAYGMSAAQIADVLNRDERTILGWQQALRKKCKTFHLSVCSLIGMVLTFLQMDEIWSYLKKKKQQLWVFITLEARTKFWVNFELESRTRWTANRLLSKLVYLMPWGFGEFLLITTDKLAAYKQAITLCLEKVNYAYLQIVKQRRKRRLVKVKQRVVKGKAEDFSSLTQNTSYIERFNLTLRQRVSYLQRKTLGYCKNRTNFKWVMWINLFNYNYRQFHKSLRVELSETPQKFQKRYRHQTPAMRMGLTTTQLTWRDLILSPIPEKAYQFTTSTVL